MNRISRRKGAHFSPIAGPKPGLPHSFRLDSTQAPIFAARMSSQLASFITRRALAELLVLVGLCITGIVVFSGIGLGLVMLSGTSVGTSADLSFLIKEGSRGRILLLLVQGLTALGGFVLIPWLIRYLMPDSPFSPEDSNVFSEKSVVLDADSSIGARVKEALPSLFRNSFIRPNATLLLLVAGLAVLMMPVNSWLAEWNAFFLRLPLFQDFYSWAQLKENELAELTQFLVRVEGPADFLLAFLVVSVVAGFSEEYFFRKLIQPRVYGLVGNMHWAIWITAFFFSAIHMQFMGFIPRLMLGALFGYYYYWTGNIWVSVFGHFLNNAITLISLFLYQANVSPINVDDPGQVPWFISSLAAALVWSLSVMVKEEAEKSRARQRASLKTEFVS